MNIITKSILTVAVAASALGTNAQEQEYQNMYLIKGDRVVGRYAVDAVDYVSFQKPEGVSESNLWLTVDNVTKNTVTYTVNAIEPTTTYAHGFISYYDANYLAMDQFGEMYDSLDETDKLAILQAMLPYEAYLGIGTQTVTRTDFESDGFSYIVLTPGTRFILCAWEVDPVTQAPLDTFVYDEFTTDAPGKSAGTLNLSFKRQNSEGLAFNISGSSDILYVTTAFGKKDVMELYTEVYGADFLFGTFGQIYTIGFLNGPNDIGGDIESATWPAWETGDYVLMVRAYDVNGDMVSANCVAHFESEAPAGPEIKIFSKSKGDGKVSINFEVTPNKVSEAYVRMMPEDEVDNKLNEGWELWELASSSSATDIEREINTLGEYTFTAEGLDDHWYTLIIYVRDNDGQRACKRINFNTLEGSNWDVRDTVYSAPARRAMARIAAKNRKPTFDKVK